MAASIWAAGPLDPLSQIAIQGMLDESGGISEGIVVSSPNTKTVGLLDRSRSSMRITSSESLEEYCIFNCQECFERNLSSLGQSSKVFSPSFYSTLKWGHKLETLLCYADISTEQYSSILKINKNECYGLYSGRINRSTNDELFQLADYSLSILSFILRLANYEPGQMGKYVRIKHLFRGSTYPPPWDSKGLLQYLEDSGHSGIMECLSWIRKH